MYAHTIINYHFRSPFQRVSVMLEPNGAVFEAVSCNDTPTKSDVQFWIDEGNAQAVKYPLRGGAVTENPCLYWGGPAVTKPPLSATANAAPILMLQTQYDGATPTEGAMTAFAAMPKAGMIYIQNEYSHGAFPYGTVCVDQAVADYFVSGAYPGPGLALTCQAKPLPGDEPVAASSIVRSGSASQQAPYGATTRAITHSSVQRSSERAYTDPARAAELIDGIHRIIRDSNPQRF